MNRCNFKEEEIIAYCYDELDASRRAQFKEHIVNCKSCIVKAEAFSKTINLVKQQKLKNIPQDILDTYLQDVKERLGIEEEISFTQVPLLREKVSSWVENLRFAFYPRFVPVFAIACIVVFVFVMMQKGATDQVSLINQDIALLDSLGEDVEEILLGSDEEKLAAAIEEMDMIMLAQAEEEVELDEILREMELFYELGEEDISEEDLLEYFQLLDEVEIDSSVG